MIRYRDYSPTPVDPKGLLGEYHNIDDFWVVPVSRTRDTGPFYDSNFEAALAMLGGESQDVQVHRFGHWGPGWFEIILVNPANAEKVKIAEEIEASLEEYPLLDETDFCSREWEAKLDSWRWYSLQDRVDLCRKAGASIFAARRNDEIPPNVDQYIEVTE